MKSNCLTLGKKSPKSLIATTAILVVWMARGAGATSYYNGTFLSFEGQQGQSQSWFSWLVVRRLKARCFLQPNCLWLLFWIVREGLWGLLTLSFYWWVYAVLNFGIGITFLAFLVFEDRETLRKAEVDELKRQQKTTFFPLQNSKKNVEFL